MFSLLLEGVSTLRGQPLRIKISIGECERMRRKEIRSLARSARSTAKSVARVKSLQSVEALASHVSSGNSMFLEDVTVRIRATS